MIPNNSDLNSKQQNITSKVSDYFGAYMRPQNLPFFTMKNLEDAFKKTKKSNVKGYDTISYQLLLNSNTDITKNILLHFYNSILYSSKIPNKINISIIKPILKNQEKMSDDLNNIRPISISTCLAQIFERLILIKSPRLNSTHKNQFGFKHKTSCNHAIFTLKETILNYTENRTGIKIVSLDAEKAFDKIWRDGLFFKLITKMEAVFWCLLKIYYDSSHGTIDLGYGVLSDLFPISIGVKQGGILSPALFHAFIDDLIHEVTSEGIGAQFNRTNISIIVYADDIILLSPVDAHLQKLLDICDLYSKSWKIKFNASKSCLMEFGPQLFKDSTFKINDSIIPKVNQITYLGVTINDKLSFKDIAIKKFLKVNKSVFCLSFLGLKPKTIPPELQSFIYKTYCLSQFTYGLETTVLNIETRKYLNTCQNNIIRKILEFISFLICPRFSWL